LHSICPFPIECFFPPRFLLQQLWSLGKHHLKLFQKSFKDNVNIFELRRTGGKTNAERRRERFRKKTTGEQRESRDEKLPQKHCYEL